jgi:WD40 repeat protein
MLEHSATNPRKKRVTLLQYILVAGATILATSQIVAFIFSGWFGVRMDNAENSEVIYPLLLYSHTSLLTLLWVVMVALLVGTWMWKQNKYLGILLLITSPCSAIMVAAAIFAAIPDMYLVQSLQVDDSVYNLTRVEELDLDLGDISFIVFQCDELGIRCRTVHITPSGTFYEAHAKLVHDETSDQLYLLRRGYPRESQNVVFLLNDVSDAEPEQKSVQTLPVLAIENIGKLHLVAQLVQGSIYKVAWTEDGNRLVTSQSRNQQQLVILEVPTNSLTQTPSTWSPTSSEHFSIYNLTFSADGRRFAAVQRDSIEVWDISKRAKLFEWKVHPNDTITHFAFGQANQTVVYSVYQHTSSGNLQEGIEILDNSGTLSHTLINRQLSAGESLNAFALSQNAQFLAEGSRELVLWDLEDSSRYTLHEAFTDLENLQYYEVRDVVFSSDDRLLASIDNQGSLSIWDTATRATLFTYADSHSYGISQLAFSPDNSLLVGVGERVLLIWSTEDGMLLHQQPLTPAFITDVAFNPQGTVIAVVGSNGIVYLFGAPLPNPDSELF